MLPVLAAIFRRRKRDVGRRSEPEFNHPGVRHCRDPHAEINKSDTKIVFKKYIRS